MQNVVSALIFVDALKGSDIPRLRHDTNDRPITSSVLAYLAHLMFRDVLTSFTESKLRFGVPNRIGEPIGFMVRNTQEMIGQPLR
jgi:hypothetical protein